MGIAWSSFSLSAESNTRNNEAPPENPVDPLADWSEDLKAAKDKFEIEFCALFLPEVGESSSEEEMGKESEALFCEFMRGGACAELFKSVQNCTDESGDYATRKCFVRAIKLNNCMHRHYHYYQPYLAVQDPFLEEAMKHFGPLSAE